MEAKTAKQFEGPRIESHREFVVGGFQGRFPNPPEGVPELWERFAPWIGKVPGQKGKVAYGIASAISGAGECTYAAGVEVTEDTKLPEEFARITIPAGKFAVFAHHAHVDDLADTIDQILKKWLPQSGMALKERSEGTPVFFERYGERFDPRAGRGDVEVWIPIQD